MTKPIKNLIKVFILIFVTQLGFSQTKENEADLKESKPIKIGIKAGYSLGKLSSPEENIYTEDYNSTNGFDVGVTFEFPQTNLISIQTEVNLTSRGGSRVGLQPITGNELSEQLNMFLPFIGLPLITDENPLYASFENNFDLKYLEIPVLAKFGWGDDFRFFVEAGPYLGILLSSKQKTNGDSQFFFDSDGTIPVIIPNPTGGQPPFIELPAQSLDAKTNTKDDLKTVNFGGILGLGVSKKVGDKGEIIFDARTSLTLNTIQFNEVFGESRVGGIIFSLGYAHSL